MCSRYRLADRSGDACPGRMLPVFRLENQRVQTMQMVWGFPGGQSGRVINARCETAAEKPMFRACLAGRRCVIPTAGFYEWDADGRQFLFEPPVEGALYLAGLYDIRAGEPCFCVLTTAANQSMAPVHDRMPLILDRVQAGAWLRDSGRVPSLLAAVPPLLTRTALDGQLGLFDV